MSSSYEDTPGLDVENRETGSTVSVLGMFVTTNARSGKLKLAPVQRPLKRAYMDVVAGLEPIDRLRRIASALHVSAMKMNELRREDALLGLALCQTPNNPQSSYTIPSGEFQATESWLMVEDGIYAEPINIVRVKLTQWQGVAHVWVEEDDLETRWARRLVARSFEGVVLPHPLGGDVRRDIAGSVLSDLGVRALVHYDPDNPDMLFENYVNREELAG